VDDADQGVFHAALPRARRGGARAAVRQVPLGRRQRRQAVPRGRGANDSRGVLKEGTLMIHIPVLRWGEPYKSLDVDKVVHFISAEVRAEVSRANAGLVERDMRHARRAREVLRDVPTRELLQMMKKAADLYAKAELPLGDGTQTPEQFVRMQSATT